MVEVLHLRSEHAPLSNTTEAALQQQEFLEVGSVEVTSVRERPMVEYGMKSDTVVV